MEHRIVQRTKACDSPTRPPMTRPSKQRCTLRSKSTESEDGRSLDIEQLAYFSFMFPSNLSKNLFVMCVKYLRLFRLSYFIETTTAVHRWEQKLVDKAYQILCGNAKPCPAKHLELASFCASGASLRNQQNMCSVDRAVPTQAWVKYGIAIEEDKTSDKLPERSLTSRP